MSILVRFPSDELNIGCSFSVLNFSLRDLSLLALGSDVSSEQKLHFDISQSLCLISAEESGVHSVVGVLDESHTILTRPAASVTRYSYIIIYKTDLFISGGQCIDVEGGSCDQPTGYGSNLFLCALTPICAQTVTCSLCGLTQLHLCQNMWVFRSPTLKSF